jgi:hypothetical protein
VCSARPGTLDHSIQQGRSILHSYHGESYGRTVVFALTAAPGVAQGLVDLEPILRKHLPPPDPRTLLPTDCALGFLLRNLVLAHAPLYRLGEWARKVA